MKWKHNENSLEWIASKGNASIREIMYIENNGNRKRIYLLLAFFKKQRIFIVRAYEDIDFAKSCYDYLFKESNL